MGGSGKEREKAGMAWDHWGVSRTKLPKEQQVLSGGDTGIPHLAHFLRLFLGVAIGIRAKGRSHAIVPGGAPLPVNLGVPSVGHDHVGPPAFLVSSECVALPLVHPLARPLFSNPVPPVAVLPGGGERTKGML